MSSLHIAGDAVADAVNPALTIAMLVVAAQQFRRRAFDGVMCLLAAAMGLACIYAIGALDHALWQRLGMDYSTHAAYATSLIASMLVWRRRWMSVLIAAGLGYLVLIVVMGYHGVIEVITASLAAVIVTFPWHVLVRRVRARSSS
jgi:hypothetical protein